ncbi:MAG: MNIO family bufferin maturase [Burkholderiaceae bacterium]
MAGIGWRHPHYGELLQRAEGPQRPVLDFIEVHSENFFAEGGAALAVLAQGRAHYPVSLHGVGLALGSAAGVDAWHLEQLARLVQRIEPARVSDHACFARGLFGARMVHAADLLPIPFHREALDVLAANVQRVQERIKRPIAVENLSAYIDWNDSEMAEPEFLAALARRSGCGLLVDVNNIYVNALNARLQDARVDPLAQCRDWLDAIPVGVVAEIHLAGHKDCGDIVIDDHGSRVIEPVWALYRHALARFGPVPTLIEWDTELPALDVLLAEAAQAQRIERTPAEPEAVP